MSDAAAAVLGIFIVVLGIVAIGVTIAVYNGYKVSHHTKTVKIEVEAKVLQP